MNTDHGIIEEYLTDLRMIYDNIHQEFIKKGIDIDLFFSNQSYCGKNQQGQPYLLAGTHPTIVHWPIQDYPGGKIFTNNLVDMSKELYHLIGSDDITWIAPSNWHCTAFSPIHSSAPDAVKHIPPEAPLLVTEALKNTKIYGLKFTRLAISRDGGILALGYPQGSDLLDVRHRLKEAFPNGTIPRLVHITLGYITKNLDHITHKNINIYLDNFVNDLITIGAIQINFLTYGNYTGPITAMRISEIFKYTIELFPEQSPMISMTSKSVLRNLSD